jgi:hypothetical protein
LLLIKLLPLNRLFMIMIRLNSTGGFTLADEQLLVAVRFVNRFFLIQRNSAITKIYV